jgi:hypothetical protein
MSEYREYSKDLWNYLGGMPYMPSRVDRDKLLNSDDPNRVQIWDFFFQIKLDDVGKPQKQEISKIEKNILDEISKYTEIQKEIKNSIQRLSGVLLWKRSKNFLYGVICLALFFGAVRFFPENNSNVYSPVLCSSPFLLSALILWLAIIFVGRGEKREIWELKSKSHALHEAHEKSIKAEIDRKNFLKLAIKELKKQVPIPPPGAEVRKWLFDHFDTVVEDSKAQTGLLDKDLLPIEGINPVQILGPGELQNPKRFPPTFTEINASDDINFDIKKHLTARRAFEGLDGTIHVLYGIYYIECILIAKDMLATYGLFYDFITGKSHSVEITEQYYDDVVSIVINEEFRWIKRNESGEKDIYIEDAPTFTMSLASGESRKVTFVSEKYFMKIKDEIGIAEENISKIFLVQTSTIHTYNAIRALRSQLRLHKTMDNIEE